ncbi:hypothetical protein VNO77_01447 [Canavalia gladiata]|uniref:Uncharacterized protein n=1 Tax=Canavalia gladiata TaxID=3824 RepID=A0AAN9MRV9_CANGL
MILLRCIDEYNLLCMFFDLKLHATWVEMVFCGRYELGSAQDLPLQCDFWALYVGLVGALYFQYFGDCINVVCATICYSILQEVCLVRNKIILTG